MLVRAGLAMIRGRGGRQRRAQTTITEPWADARTAARRWNTRARVNRFLEPPMSDSLTSNPLSRLIAEASVLAGGKHPCAVLGHQWMSIGGRPCPFHEHGCGGSQAVYECSACGDTDYGEREGEPGYDFCKGEEFNCGGFANER